MPDQRLDPQVMIHCPCSPKQRRKARLKKREPSPGAPQAPMFSPPYPGATSRYAGHIAICLACGRERADHDDWYPAP